MTQPRITLDQWGALVAVVEAGGYAQASSRLHRTQSTVTYTIKKLEDLLGVVRRRGDTAAAGKSYTPVCQPRHAIHSRTESYG
mgnify:CR=1 FL=1